MLRALKMAVCVGFLLAAASCDIGFGGGPPFTLQVFWVPQQNPYYCVPASIHMWALYDGYAVTQDAIALYVGTAAPGGTPAFNVPGGVQHFTAQKDAAPYVAFGGGPLYYSRQITSINNGEPFLAIFNAQHVVIASGGQWHTDDSTGLYVWDVVVYQDPAAGGPNSSLVAGDWIELNDADVIGQAASAKSLDNLNLYGPNTHLRGSNYHFQV
jgi:hypothetical protein